MFDLRTDVENMPKDGSLVVLTYFEDKQRFSWWYCFYDFKGNLFTESIGSGSDHTIPCTEKIVAWIALPSDRELRSTLGRDFNDV